MTTTTTTMPLSDGRITAEVVRQVLTFLSPTDAGRWLLLTSKSFTEMIGEELVWKTLCEKHQLLFPPPSNSSSESKESGSGGGHTAEIDYKTYFQQRRCRPIHLACSNTLQPLKTSPSTTYEDWNVVVDVWCESNSDESTNPRISKWLSRNQIQELLEYGKVTIEDGFAPILNRKHVQEKAHGWNLPTEYNDQWRARIQLFRKKKKSSSASSNKSGKATTATNATAEDDDGGKVLLDTNFTVWRPWSSSGELTFIQKNRNNGLALTDRGQGFEYRIIRSTRTPRTTNVGASRRTQTKRTNWEGYLGFQGKLVLLCEKYQRPQPKNDNDSTSRGGDDEGQQQMISFAFTKIRLELIRLHENEHGNIRHYLFCPDNSGWNRHGIHVLHLIEELI